MDQCFEIKPVGYVRRKEGKLLLEITPPYVPALKELEHFSYAQVLWWCHYLGGPEHRETMPNDPPYDAPVTGVFASRSPVRPNPIALTTVKVIAVDHKKGLVEIARIDAADDSPVINIKPYIKPHSGVRTGRSGCLMTDWIWMINEAAGLIEMVTGGILPPVRGNHPDRADWVRGIRLNKNSNETKRNIQA